MPKLRIPADFSEANLWQFIIDHHFLKNARGLINYEKREPGCIIGLLRAYRTMLQSNDIQLLNLEVNETIVVDDIVARTLRYHDLLTTQVKNLKTAEYGRFRSNPVNYGFDDRTSTPKGLEHLTKREYVRGPNDQKIPLYYKIHESKVYSQDMKTEEVEAIFRQLCMRLIADLRFGKDQKSKLHSIAEFTQDAMALHPFGDVNNRTLVINLLNDILFSIGETPTVFEEANVVDAFDIDALVIAIKEAQRLYQELITAGKEAADLDQMRYEGLLHLAAGAGELPLMRAILAPLNDWEKDQILKQKIAQKTALQVAIEYSQAAAVDLLIQELKIDAKFVPILQTALDPKMSIDANITDLNLRLSSLSIAEVQKALELFATFVTDEEKTSLYLFLLSKVGPKSRLANIYRGKVDNHYWRLDQIYGLLHATALLPTHGFVKEFFSDANNELTIMFFADDNTKLMLQENYAALFLILLLRSLRSHRNTEAKQFLIKNGNVDLLRKIFIKSIEWTKDNPEGPRLPLCMDLYLLSEFFRNKSEEQREQFVEVLKENPKFFPEILTDIHSFKMLGEILPKSMQQVDRLNLLIENKEALEKITHFSLHSLIELADYFGDPIDLQVLPRLMNEITDRLTRIRPVKRALEEIKDELENVKYKDQIYAIISSNEELLRSLQEVDAKNVLRTHYPQMPVLITSNTVPRKTKPT